jgi:hypothetical protein
MLQRDWLRLLIGCVSLAEGETLEGFRPGRLKPVRVEQVMTTMLRRSLFGQALNSR